MTHIEYPRQQGPVETQQQSTHGRIFDVLKRGVGGVANAAGKTVNVVAHGLRRFVLGIFGH